MPITEPEWTSIRAMIESVAGAYSGRRNVFFITSVVLKRDDVKKLVWVAEFGDQPIPVVGFRYKVKYYDETPHGTVVPAVGTASPYKTLVKIVEADVITPDVGASVFIARELGTNRLPRCIGEIQGVDWLIEEDE